MSWPFSNSSAPDYDSDFVAVPATLTVLTAADLWLIGANVVNDTDAEITLLITDGANQPIVPTIPIPARSVHPPFEWPFLPVSGVKWQASDTGLVVKLWGYTQ